MKISLIGVGPGSEGLLCLEARKQIDDADVLIGGDRLVKTFGRDKTCYSIYKPEEIIEKIKNTGVGKNVAILLSGDPGFFSSAKKLFLLLDGDDVLKEQEINVIPGISSMQYFLENLHLSWESIRFISLHGRKANVIGYIRDNRRVFTLLGSGTEIRDISEKLHYYGMDHVKIIVGSRLSYPDEKIFVSDPRSFLDGSKGDLETDRLSVALFINEKAEPGAFCSIGDNEFKRGNVPMTKEEVRTLSISKLKLKSTSRLFDIGAGTGSVSVEAALKLTDGEVYAIEKSSEALDLIMENKRRFAADNIEIINGSAPDCLDSLPVPSHVFIGGSGGRLREILEKIRDLNSEARIVINAVSLKTLSNALETADEFKYQSDVTLVNIAKTDKDSDLRMMKGNNPVYIICLYKAVV